MLIEFRVSYTADTTFGNKNLGVLREQLDSNLVRRVHLLPPVALRRWRHPPGDGHARDCTATRKPTGHGYCTPSERGAYDCCGGNPEYGRSRGAAATACEQAGDEGTPERAAAFSKLRPPGHRSRGQPSRAARAASSAAPPRASRLATKAMERAAAFSSLSGPPGSGRRRAAEPRQRHPRPSQGTRKSCLSSCGGNPRVRRRPAAPPRASRLAQWTRALSSLQQAQAAPGAGIAASGRAASGRRNGTRARSSLSCGGNPEYEASPPPPRASSRRRPSAAFSKPPPEGWTRALSSLSAAAPPGGCRRRRVVSSPSGPPQWTRELAQTGVSGPPPRVPSSGGAHIKHAYAETKSPDVSNAALHALARRAASTASSAWRLPHFRTRRRRA